MIFTIRFKVLVAAIFLSAILTVVAYNQYLLQNEFNKQGAFDQQVMDRDTKIWNQLEQLATRSATLTPAPTEKAKLIAR